MSVAPASLAELLAATRFEEVRTAIVSRLGALLPGVKVISHPGKADIDDVIGKAVVAAPGIALGWTRIRSVRDLGGTYGVPVDWMAYLVTEDYADRSTNPPRSVARDAVASAIGGRLLRILADPDAASWGLTGITPPFPDPEPFMQPVMTTKAGDNATALFVVSWTQAILDQGEALFDGRSPEGAEIPDGLEFEWGDGPLPTELRAVFGQEGET